MITKEELEENGFFVWFDKTGNEWSYDGDYVMYNIKQQTLYQSDEIKGNHIKLCVVKDINKLKELIWFYFKIDVDEEK
jgi:hypothetical protein